MQVINLVRKFKYNSISLVDPNAALTPEGVKEFYAAQYAELNNSVIEGPVTKDGTATYTFTRAVGAKGATAAEVIERTLAMDGSAKEALLLSASENVYAGESVRVASVCASRQGGVPMSVPAQAFGLWG